MTECGVKERKLELYLHIPFCRQKCQYCDFLSAPSDQSTQEQYVKALKKEIRKRAEIFHSYSVPSIFIGGGTPSVLPAEALAGILDTVYASFSVEKTAEITIECNPGTLNKEKTEDYRSAGINRISLGLQSVHNHELQLLGRIHTYEQFLMSYDLVRKAGFDNVNVDLMSGLPGQTLADWQGSLKKIVSLQPEHISAYSLIIEEGTPFYVRFGEDEQRREEGQEPLYLPTEETEREMYAWTGEYLAGHGYRHYEISNYACPGRECRHNIGYWRRENYLGLGLGSASLVENVRLSNTTDMDAYLTAQDGEGIDASENLQHLSRREQMEEFMFLGLRMMEGVSRLEFRSAFGVELEGVYGDVIRRLCDQGLLMQQAGYVLLTEEGISVSNYVMSEFLK